MKLKKYKSKLFNKKARNLHKLVEIENKTKQGHVFKKNQLLSIKCDIA